MGFVIPFFMIPGVSVLVPFLLKLSTKLRVGYYSIIF